MIAANPRFLGWICITLYFLIGASHAETVRVRYRQGSVHGYASLKTLEGKTLAIGDSTQTIKGGRVTSRFILRFFDGSIDDEVTVFEQRQVFRLISDRHIQHGPSFPKPIDLTINAVTGDLTIRAEDGTLKHEHMELPEDLANGLPPNLLLNIPPTTAETKISYLAAGDKPRLVHLSIKPAGTVPFLVGRTRHKATDFIIHVEIGGIAGVVAPLVGKQPADFHILIENGAPPTFIREEGALYDGGPIWRIEQICPSFP